MHTITIFLSIFFVLLARHVGRLVSNWRAAKRLHLPIVICPFDRFGIFWDLFGKRISRHIRWLPGSLGTFTRVTWIGWEYFDKGRIHQELGPTFVIVSSSRNEIVFSEPEHMEEVLSRYKAFPKTKQYRVYSLEHDTATSN